MFLNLKIYFFEVSVRDMFGVSDGSNVVQTDQVKKTCYTNNAFSPKTI